MLEYQKAVEEDMAQRSEQEQNMDGVGGDHEGLFG